MDIKDGFNYIPSIKIPKDIFNKINEIHLKCFNIKIKQEEIKNLFYYSKTDNKVLFTMSIEEILESNTIFLWSVCSSENNKGYLRMAIKELTSHYNDDIKVRLIAWNKNFNISFNERLIIYHKLGFEDNSEETDDLYIGGRLMETTILNLKINLLKKMLIISISFLYNKYTRYKPYKLEITTIDNDDVPTILKKYKEINNLLLESIQKS